MKDISTLSKELISKLAVVYSHAVYNFGIDPVKASEKKQRKIRKWISRQYTELEQELLKNADIFLNKKSDTEFLLFLKECLNFEEQLAKKKEEKIETDFAAFDAITKYALKKLLTQEFWPHIKFVGNDIQIIVDSITALNISAFEITLTFKNAENVPKGKEYFYCKNTYFELRKDGKFYFCGEIEDLEEEKDINFSLAFESVKAEIKIYNSCSNLLFWANPWEILQAASLGIKMKFDLSANYCNEKEKELLPLVEEIAALEYREYFTETLKQKNFSFNTLKGLAVKYNYKKVKVLLERLERINSDSYKFYEIGRKLISILCLRQYEPLWREIYNKIMESQKEYPSKTEYLCNKQLLADVRKNIQKYMELKGYKGTYPDFVKYEKLKGLHLEESYNVTYFVGMEKRVVYRIYCNEFYNENEELTVQFICGTVFLKKHESEKDIDIYGCSFNANGKRLLKIGKYVEFKNNVSEEELELPINIAVKKA